MRRVRVSAINFLSGQGTNDFEYFKNVILDYLDKVQTSDIVVFPEYMNLAIIDYSKIPVSSWAEAVKEYVYDFTCFMRAEAMKRGQVIVVGIIDAYHTPIQNEALIFYPDGQYFVQHKTKIIHREQKWGCVPEETKKPKVYDLGYTKIGINICYEVEFPEIARDLVKNGMEILIVPSATFSEPGYDRVAICAQARAIENQIFVVHSAFQGKDTSGLSSIWTPRDVDWPGFIGEESLGLSTITAELDLDRLQELRQSSSANTLKDFMESLK